MAARSNTSREDLGHLLSVGSLVVGVLVVLLIGAVLRSTDVGESEPAPPPASPPERAADPAVAAPHPPTDRRAATDPLADRIATDLDRLPRADGAWTAQLVLLCDEDRARRLLADHGRLEALYLLPATHDRRSCVRACWGGYPGPDEARAARDLPAALRRMQPSPLPKRVAEVTR